MRVAVPTELKPDEYRVGLAPAGVRELVDLGHQVAVQRGAGLGSAFADAEYEAQGARMVDDASEVFVQGELIVKVKEPERDEVGLIEPRHVLFAYLHLAADPALTARLCDSGATCIAYETVEDAAGRLPLLAPMSEVAGRLAAQAGAAALEKPHGGRGTLIGGVPGVPAGRVMVIGGGVVGANAAAVAIGMGGEVHVFDRDVNRLRDLDARFGGRLQTAYASTLELEQFLPHADLVIGAVLVHGARAPRVVGREQLGAMKQGAVLVDVSIDQGGCFETSRPTTHSRPTFVLDGVVHYAVANIPAAVPITATRALTNATLPYVVRLAELGPAAAAAADAGLAAGVNVVAGEVTHAAVAEAAGRPHIPVAEALQRAARA